MHAELIGDNPKDKSSGARIGASRVIQQAERFLREQWQELQKNNLVQQKLGLYINHIELQQQFAEKVDNSLEYCKQ